MKAAVCRTFGEPFGIEEVDLRPPGPGEVSVRVKACAVCHSDLLFASGGWGGDLPAIYGHEAAGEVEAVGPGVVDLAPGDAVVATMVRSCGRCACCAGGLPGACESGDFAAAIDTPVKGAGGEPIVHGMKIAAFAERALTHRSQLVKAGGELPWEVGALLACGGVTGYGAVANTAEFARRDRSGASAVVIGAGGVGLHSVQAAAHFGAAKVIAIDLATDRLEIAETCGATHGLIAGPGAAEEVRRLTGGRGADFVFVTVGATAAIEQSLEMLAPGGWSVLAGIPAVGAVARLDPVGFVSGARRLVGSKMGDSDIQADIPRLIDLYRNGRWRLDELVGERFEFNDINAAMARAQGGGLRSVVLF